MKVLPNDAARAIFLHRHGLLSGPSSSGGLDALVQALGFVQIDSVNTVARAHDLILWSRRPAYRPDHLDRLLARDRGVFEHWTHDAAAIPIAFYPHWRHRFARDAERLAARWTDWQGNDFLHRFDQVLDRIARDGPVTSGDLAEGETRRSTGWWDWHPSKTALEFLWRTGQLAVARREGFRKVYDLSERVIPEAQRLASPDPGESRDWAMNAALDRLGFATSGELAAFWKLVSPEAAQDWCSAERRAGRIEEIAVAGADGSLRRHLARPGLTADGLPQPGPRLRILSPFDPALRDRKRAERLFGFHYRIEIFVPEAQRRYGYYVFPILEGTRIAGRIDMRADRAAGCLAVRALWPEPGVRFGRQRIDRLMAELDRIGRFSGCDRVTLAPDWLRD